MAEEKCLNSKMPIKPETDRYIYKGGYIVINVLIPNHVIVSSPIFEYIWELGGVDNVTFEESFEDDYEIEK